MYHQPDSMSFGPCAKPRMDSPRSQLGSESLWHRLAETLLQTHRFEYGFESVRLYDAIGSTSFVDFPPVSCR